MSRGTLALAALLLFIASSANAQAPLPPSRPADDAPLPETTIPPYQAKLERLAELMGTLAFMRSLCGTGDGALWRNKMSELLVAEGTTVDRRDRLAGAFNHGLRSYAATYRICTPAARTVIGRSLAEGEKLTNDLATHFGS